MGWDVDTRPENCLSYCVKKLESRTQMLSKSMDFDHYETHPILCQCKTII